MAQNVLNFMQFFAKFGKVICWRPPGGLVPPPTGNPGSAPVKILSFMIYNIAVWHAVQTFVYNSIILTGLELNCMAMDFLCSIGSS